MLTERFACSTQSSRLPHELDVSTSICTDEERGLVGGPALRLHATSQTGKHSGTPVPSPILGPENGRERLFIERCLTGVLK